MDKNELAELKKILVTLKREIKRAEQILETSSLNLYENNKTPNILNLVDHPKSRIKITQLDAVQQWNKVAAEIDNIDTIEGFQIFLHSLTSKDLAVFIKFNRLPINSKMKKEQIVSGIMQLLKAGQAIQQPIRDNNQHS